MALDYDNQEQSEDEIFPVDFDENTELDRYGVWIKKKPQQADQKIDNPEEEEPLPIDEAYDDIIDIDDAEDIGQEEIIEFDDIEEFNELPEVDVSGSEKSLENKSPEDNLDDSSLDSEDKMLISDELVAEKQEEEEKEEDMEVNEFETLDLDDFLNEDELEQASEPKEEVADLNIENISDKEESVVSDDTISFEEPESSKASTSSEEVMVTDKMEETSEFDDLLSDLGADIPSDNSSKEEADDDTIDMNISIDEDSDISSIAGKGANDDESLDAINIFGDVTPPKKEKIIAEEEKKVDNKTEDDDLVIESVIIEADNMDAIREENEKILNQSSEKTEIEDKEELDSLDSMLDDLMGGEPSFSATETKVEHTEPAGIAEEPMFEISPNNEFDDDNQNLPDNIEIPDENGSIFFDDVEALEKEMLDAEPPVAEESNDFDITATPAVPAVAIPQDTDSKHDDVNKNIAVETDLQNDKATEILLQIAGELSSIKTELSNLKSEMATKGVSPVVDISSAETSTHTSAVQTKISDNDENTGFFSDDDSDETIALTGDELNNILITADFTEKQTDTDDDDFAPQDLDGEIETVDNSADDIQIPEMLDESLITVANAGSEVENSEDFLDNEEIVRDLHTEPISKIDDDVSYLDEQDDEVIYDKPEDYIDIPDFNNDELEEPNLDNFDMTISELELPNGQSIALGKPDENIKAIDSDQFDDINFDDSIIDNEPEFDSLTNADVNIADEEEIFDPNELDSATEEIPHLELETNTAEKHKLDVPASDEASTPAIPKGLVNTTLNKQEALPIHLKEEIKSVLSYMDQLLESLPENKIEEFAKSEYFDTYKRLFDELGIS